MASEMIYQTFREVNTYPCEINFKNFKERHISKLTLQFSSVAQSCPTLCESMKHSTPGLPVHHQLQESTQTHVH